MGFFLYLIPVALYLLYKWGTKNHDYFEKQGISYVKPLPLLGSNFSLFFKKQPLVTFLMNSYNEYKKDKVVGAFEFRRPTCTIYDPKIVKFLAVKEFDYFADHRSVIDADMDPLFGKVLTALKGQKWKDMRSTLSPAFTGSKMRQMFDFVSSVGQQTAKSMKDEINKGSENSFEFKALAAKFSVDVIASCAFGIEVNSFKNPGNDFYKISQKITNPNMTLQIIKFLGFMLVPKVMTMLKIDLVDKDLKTLLKESITETMKIREEKGIIRHDMINLLMQAKRGQLAHNVDEKIVEGFATVEESQVGKSEVQTVYDDNDLVAQCLLFFLAGFDTVATTMSFTVYELVANPDIQQKLFEEVQGMNSSLGGKKISYEQIQGMKYLDQVISETLRKWPAAPFTDRQCVREYDLKYDDKTLHFTTDMNFAIPIYCFHHDPEYFPEPEKFDPDRFNEENRGSIDPDTYLPFGVGPRNCIGSRFALMELKTIFYYLLLNFSFEANEKTQIPLEYEKIPFGMRPEKGIWASLKPRTI